LSGLYFAVILSLALAVIFWISDGSPGAAVLAALGLVTWPLFAMSIKHRWGQRPDAKDRPHPTPRRMLSRSSDRWLSWGLWFGLACIVFTPISLLTGGISVPVALVTLVGAVYLATATWMERRRRARGE
jgi:Na+/H+ antiporter NhaD/arsenite permease-like protein